jgi:integrase
LNSRDLALFNLAIDSKLRGCDLVRLRVNDVCIGGQIRDRATVIQRKTGRLVQFEITEQTRAAIRDWLANIGPASGQYLFPSRFHGQPHISTGQYARIVHRWVKRADLASSVYGTHSLRRTKVAQIYKKTGNLRADPHASFGAAPTDGRDDSDQLLASSSPSTAIAGSVTVSSSANAVFGIFLSRRMGIELPCR